MNPPGHTIPTDHIYLNLSEFRPTTPVDIISPGDIRIIGVQFTLQIL